MMELIMREVLRLTMERLATTVNVPVAAPYAPVGIGASSQWQRGERGHVESKHCEASNFKPVRWWIMAPHLMICRKKPWIRRKTPSGETSGF